VYSVCSLYVITNFRGLLLCMFMLCGKLNYLLKSFFFFGWFLTTKFSLEIICLRGRQWMTRLGLDTI
jgi:hypothetical protein